MAGRRNRRHRPSFSEPAGSQRPSGRDPRCSRRQLAGRRPPAPRCYTLEPRTARAFAGSLSMSTAEKWKCRILARRDRQQVLGVDRVRDPNDCRNRSTRRRSSVRPGPIQTAEEVYWRPRGSRPDRHRGGTSRHSPGRPRRWRRSRARCCTASRGTANPRSAAGAEARARTAEHGGTPAAEEQEVGTAFVPMLRGAERAEDERGDCQHQDEKP